MNYSKIIYLLTLAALCSGVIPATAGGLVVELESSDVTTINPADTTLGDYYTVQVDLPSGLTATTFRRAFLELTFNVSVRSDAVFETPAPVLEVFSLAQDLQGDFDEEDLRQPSSMKRGVRTGDGQTVRVDITPAIKRFLANANDNHGLIVGSLTKGREGVFALRDTGDAKGRIVYHW